MKSFKQPKKGVVGTTMQAAQNLMQQKQALPQVPMPMGV